MPSCNTYHLTWVSVLGRGVSLHGCSSKAQPLLLTLDEGYLLTTTLPDLRSGIASIIPNRQYYYYSQLIEKETDEELGNSSKVM